MSSRIERRLIEQMSDADNWMSLNGDCNACNKQHTLCMPMSTPLQTDFRCNHCEVGVINLTRVLMVCGVPKDGHETIVFKSLECEALEAMYKTQEEEA